MEAIRKIAASESPINRLTLKFAPSIKGLTHIKRSILLQMFGCDRQIHQHTKEVMRGDLHVLMVGDPATGKTALQKFTANVTPRGRFINCYRATAAGLTAAVTEEGGEYVLDAGAMVLASGGIACLEEFGRLKDEVKPDLLDAMSIQEITVNKAKIHESLSTITPVLAGCNPKHGKFADDKDIRPQIDIDDPVLSRFDLVYIIKDIPNELQDTVECSHILNFWCGGQYEDFDISILPTYIQEAKKIDPSMYDPGDGGLFNRLMEKIKTSYVMMRQQYDAFSVVPIDKRHLFTLIRLAKAHARSRLSSVVSEGDVDVAVSILMDCIAAAAEEGVSASPEVIDEDLRQVIDMIEANMLKLMNMNDRFKIAVPGRAIVESVNAHGFQEKTVWKGINMLLKDNRIWKVGDQGYHISR